MTTPPSLSFAVGEKNWRVIQKLESDWDGILLILMWGSCTIQLEAISAEGEKDCGLNVTK